MEIEQKPERLVDPKHICYWAEREGILLGSMKNKAKRFLDYGCVLETQDPNVWVVKNIKDYNKTNHQVDLYKWTCTCQANRKNGIECSHMKAVHLFLYQRKWNKNSK